MTRGVRGELRPTTKIKLGSSSNYLEKTLQRPVNVQMSQQGKFKEGHTSHVDPCHPPQQQRQQQALLN